MSKTKDLSVCRIPCSDGKQRHIIARVESAMDGGMFEFHDPLTNEVVGCVGRNRVDEFVTSLTEWIETHYEWVKSLAEPSACPNCGAVANNPQEEIAHMEANHPDVIEKRMVEAGFTRDPSTGEWVDGWADPNG